MYGGLLFLRAAAFSISAFQLSLILLPISRILSNLTPFAYISVFSAFSFRIISASYLLSLLSGLI